jgi:integrase
MNTYETLRPRFYPARNRWAVDVPPQLSGGKRTRKFFPTETEAIKAAAEMSISHGMGHLKVPSSGKPTIRSLAARWLAGSHTKMLGKRMTKANLRQQTWAVTMLVEKFGHAAPAELKREMVAAWIESLDLTTRGRFNVFAVCRVFYNSDTMFDHCESNPFRTSPPRQDKDHRLPILTPPQMRKLLKGDFPRYFLNWLVCGGFAGLRTIEVLRMDHSAIDWKYDEILVRKSDSKQGKAEKPRTVTILPAFARHMPKQKGMIMEGYTEKRFRKCLAGAKKILGEEKWLKNSLRHSFASYHLSAFKDAARTSFEIGHESPRLLYNTYANLVARRDAEAWWKL